jgi:uncharacterized protein YbjT (DUF2867 family)
MVHHDDDRADALRALGAIGQVFELTGPRSQDMNGVAEEYARAAQSG